MCPFDPSDNTVAGDCGGSASVTVDGDESGNTDGTIVYNNFCVVGDTSNTIINGTVTFSFTSTMTTFTYTNVTVNDGTEIHTFNMTYTCSSAFVCNWSSDFAGDNGTNYQTGNVQISGNNSSGYDISASVSDPTYGTVTFTAANITICSNGSIGSGTVQVIDTSDTVVTTVTFPDCDTVVVTLTARQRCTVKSRICRYRLIIRANKGAPIGRCAFVGRSHLLLDDDNPATATLIIQLLITVLSTYGTQSC